jgi:o-succinylbenzoate synthase
MLSCKLSPIEANTALQNAKNQWSVRRGILLQIQDQHGIIGLGEASPLPNYSSDTLEEARASLSHLEASLQTIGELSVASIERFSSSVALTSSARFALETALLDLLGQRDNCTIAQLLCDTPREEIGLNALLILRGEEETLKEARRLIGLGYHTLKCKPSTGQAEVFLREVEAIRREFPEVRLRLDANGAWTTNEARHWLSKLAGQVEFVEQPTATLSSLGACETDWAADESLQNTEDSEKLLEEKQFAALVLKPMALGGIFRCLDLARRAHPKASVVTHLFDGPIALAAACELARAIPGALLDCGLDDHPGLALMPEVAPPHLCKDAKRSSPGGFGVGLSREQRDHVSRR